METKIPALKLPIAVDTETATFDELIRDLRRRVARPRGGRSGSGPSCGGRREFPEVFETRSVFEASVGLRFYTR